MIVLDNFSPEDLLILTNVLAVSFSEDKNADQINVLGNFLVGVGCLMLTIAAQQQYLATLQDTNNNNTNTTTTSKSTQQNTNNSTDSTEDTIIG